MRALFIGNSYTYYNRMPEIVATLAASSGSDVHLTCKSVTQGGVSLEWHAHNEDTLRAIRQGGWDAVVLQEQSTRPVRERDQMLSFAQLLAQEIKSVNARPVLYATWAREHIPEMIEPLTLSYAACADVIAAEIAPVGLAFAAVREQCPAISLYAPDHSHPSPAGSFLAACVLLKVLAGINPVGVTGRVLVGEHLLVSLDKATAMQLQSIAAATVAQAG